MTLKPWQLWAYILTLIAAAVVLRVTGYVLPVDVRLLLALICGLGLGYSLGLASRAKETLTERRNDGHSS